MVGPFRALICAVCLAAPLSFPPSAGAASPAERAKALAHYEAGSAYFAKGDYDRAIAELVLAIGYDRRPEYVWNIARAHEKKGDVANARHYYQQFRSLATTADERRDADAKLLALERLEAERRSVGRIILKSNVLGARVSIDGKPRGTTPLDELVQLTIGGHTIALEKDGYEPLMVNVDVEGALTKTVHLEMVPLDDHITGELDLRVAEEGALVRLDGVELGLGPLRRVLPLGVGHHEVTVLKDGLLPWVRSIEIARGERQTLSPELAPIPDADDGTQQAWGWVLTGIGAVATGVGVYLLLDPPETTTVTGDVTIVETDRTVGTVVTAAGATALGAGILLLTF